MIFAIFFVMFLFLLILPFLLAIKELLRPLDARALSIDMDYSRDPRYFGNSFKGMLEKALGAENLSEGIRHITLSKSETVEIVSKKKISTGNTVDHLMYVMGNLTAQENVTLNKEIFVDGKATISKRCMLRALVAEGKVSLGSKTKVIRWVDAESDFTADPLCDLGWSISSGKRLKISSGCSFRRLYGMPIQTCNEDPEKEIADPDQECLEIGDAAFISDKDWTTIPPNTKIDKTLIFKQNLRIKRNCVLDKDVKTYKKLVLEAAVRIKGSVFAENGITTGPCARIFGNIFSQEAIHLGQGSKIGRANATKSVVARGEVVLEGDVVIYGYVVAGKRGRVL